MKNKDNSIIKLIMSIVYIVVIIILFISAFKIYEKNNEIVPYSKAEDTSQYSKITISKMSEKFAHYKKNDIGLHFVVEKENTGMWHTYIIAINENEISKYQNIIDYTYDKTTEIPEEIEVYGYPTQVTNKTKELAIKNLPNFFPKDNEVIINEENYEAYLTNCYLDTTKEKKEKFDVILFTVLILLFTTIVLLILTILSKNKKIGE